jgi:hypothetical protein
MKYISIAIIYAAFFGMIAAACYFTTSAMPLWALLLTPSFAGFSKDSTKELIDEE